MINIEENIKLSQFTTFRIGGLAKYFVKAKNNQELTEALSWAEKNEQKVQLIGGGSNILVSDKGFDGLVVVYKGGNYAFEGQKLITEGSVFTALLALKSREQNLGGLEFASGIPGTIGGAIVGNAGAYGQSMSDILASAKVWEKGEVKDYQKKDFDFGYRYSKLKNQNEKIIIEATFILSNDSKLDDTEIANDKVKRTKDYIGANAGSYFKNIDIKELDKTSLAKLKPFITHSKVAIGKINESLGLKGLSCGGAQISERHANVIVNTGEATASDVLCLEKKVINLVEKKYGIILTPEVVKIGF